MYKVLAVFLVAGALLSLQAQAAPVHKKIGIVDVSYILSHSKAGKSALKQLKSYAQSAQSSLQKEQQKLQQEEETLKKNASIESKAVQDKQKKQFKSDMATFQQHYQKTRQGFYKKRQELLQPLQAKLYDIIQKYAKAHGYGLILNQSPNSVVYSDGSYDLTDVIMKSFDRIESHGKHNAKSGK